MTAPITGAVSAFSACPPPSGAESRLVDLDERLEATFDSGTRVRFWGVDVPLVDGRAPAGGREKLLGWLSSVPVSVKLLATAPDRWGRLEAHVYGGRAGHPPLSVAEALMDAGLARVRPESGEPDCLAHLFSLEAEAIRQQLGLWAIAELRPPSSCGPQWFQAAGRSIGRREGPGHVRERDLLCHFPQFWTDPDRRFCGDRAAHNG